MKNKKLWKKMDEVGIFDKDKFEDDIIKQVGEYHDKDKFGYDNLGFTYPDIREAIRLTKKELINNFENIIVEFPVHHAKIKINNKLVIKEVIIKSDLKEEIDNKYGDNLK